MIVAGGGLVVYVNSTRKEQEELKKKNTTKSVGRPDLGGPFQLTDHNGKECTDKDYIGKWLMVYFGFTFCPDICPDELDKLTAVLNKLGKTDRCICLHHIATISETATQKYFFKNW